MAKPMNERLGDIRRKLTGIERLELTPLLSEDEVAAFEQANGVMLPEDYRAFLLTVANGVRGRFSVGSILPLYTWFKDDDAPPFKGEVIRGDLRKPFPLTEAVSYEEEGYPEEDEGPDADGTAPGKVFIHEIGCGDYRILVVTGPERGNMWTEGYSGYQPTEPRVSFVDWMERWTDNGGESDLLDSYFPMSEDL